MLDAHVLKKRDEFEVDVRLQVARGGALGLFGSSGAGKSTVLACIAGAQTQDGGHVVLDGRTLFPPALPLRMRGVGYLTQHADLFPHLTVEQNIRFGVHEATDATERWIVELRDRFELATIWHARADAISGGQERRVAFARMLARKPPLVLLDEPFAGLDRHLVREAIVSMNEWHRDLGFTLLVVDHDAEILERLCAEALVLERGRAVQRGSWTELRAAPATALLAKLLAPL